MVCVDRLRYYGVRASSLPRRVWAHMAADSLKELHEFASRIGLKREWFQEHKRHPHYDITESKYNAAVKHGALVVSRLPTALRRTE